MAIAIGPKKKIGFVCSGGATKAGAFHLGVALALQERGFKFVGGLAGAQPPVPNPMDISIYVGSSAGSIISTLLAAGYSLDNIFNSFLGRHPKDPQDTIPRILPRLSYQKLFRINRAAAKEQLSYILEIKKLVTAIRKADIDTLLEFKWLKATGLFSTLGIEQYMREDVLLSNRFQDYVAELFIVATQLNQSRKVVFGKKKNQPPAHDPSCIYETDSAISDACAASTALPVIFTPYGLRHADGHKHWYIDGEIRDTLSSHVAVDAGADLVFASYTHQPYHFQADFGSLTQHGLPAILVQSIYLLIEQKVNNYVHNKLVQRRAIDAVLKYCRDNGVAIELREKICEILEQEFHHRRDVDIIYIHPDRRDAAAFFGEHFTLNSKKMGEIVRSGFRAAVDVLKRYEFADRPKSTSSEVISTASTAQS